MKYDICDCYRASLAHHIRENHAIRGFALMQVCDFLQNNCQAVWDLVGRHGLSISPIIDDTDRLVKLCSTALWVNYGPNPALILKQENRIYLSKLAQVWHEKSSFEELVVCGRDVDGEDIQVLVRFDRVTGALNLQPMTWRAGK